MIEIRHLTKRYGAHAAVDGLTFTVHPGHVTGFLGPNGAGKSTTMRIVLGLDAPTSGTATVAGRPYRTLDAPLQTVGALLDAESAHPARRARDHLTALARSNGIAARRVDEVLDVVGLAQVARQRVGGFSLGMRQRLGIAAALLGDPEVLILDEPGNGLDTSGLRWLRALLRAMAAEGRTVLVSSHVMSEVEHTADRLVVIGSGRLLAESTTTAFLERHASATAYVRTPEPAELAAVLGERAARLEPEPDGGWVVHGADVATVGDLAAGHGIRLRELRARRPSLEEVYTELVGATDGAGAGHAPTEGGR